MIKKIALLFIITGAGHGFSILALKFIAERGSATQLADIGEVESLIQFMIGLIGFGMQTDAIRNIALDQDWKQKLKSSQTARITLSIVLMLLSFFSYSNEMYLCFIVAPLLASNCDYALYARGFSITGAIVAFSRVFVPLLLGILFVYYWPQYILLSYLTSTIAIYLITNIFISFYLRIPVVNAPSISSLKLYWQAFPLGIITLCYFFFGLGLQLFAQLFFTKEELVLSFLGLKFYLIYRGALRVILQAFVSRMTDVAVCLSIDQISIILGLSFVGSVAIFPDTFISFFFGIQYKEQQSFFIFLALSALVFSICVSLWASALLERKDVIFMKIAIAAVCVSIVLLIVMNQFSKKIEVITISLLAGEIFFTLALSLAFFNWSAIWSRISFLLVCSLALGIPSAARIIFNESLVTYLISFGVMGVLILSLSYKKFVLPLQTMN